MGRRIAAVDDHDAWVCRPHAPGELAGALVGSELTAAHRCGKSMWCDTSEGGPRLGLHLGMAGRIAIDEPPAPGAWDRFSLEFEDGGRMALRDKRRLSRVLLDPDLANLGPDAARIPRAAFRERVGRGQAPLKARLLDQSVLAGVGNLLADQALWEARLSPSVTPSSLTEEELDRLRRALRSAIRSASRRGGVHTGNFVEVRGRDGHCPACGQALERATIAGRTTYWCPDCQC